MVTNHERGRGVTGKFRIFGPSRHVELVATKSTTEFSCHGKGDYEVLNFVTLKTLLQQICVALMEFSP